MDPAIIVAVIGAAATIAAAVAKALTSRRKKRDEGRTLPAQMARAGRDATVVGPGAQDKSKRIEAQLIAGTTIIQADNVVVGLDFLGLLLGESGIRQGILDEIQRQVESPSVPVPDVGGSRHVGNLRRRLSSVLEEVPGEERREPLVDILGCIGSVVDKYKGHSREHDFPYGLFCKDLVDSLGHLDIADAILTTPPLLESHGEYADIWSGVYLRTLSSLFPDKGFLSEHPTGFYLHKTADRVDMHFVFPQSRGWRRSREEHTKETEGSLLSRLLRRNSKVQEPSDARKPFLKSAELRFKERKITISRAYIHDELRVFDLADFDFGRFATFVVAIVTDFMLLSLAALRHDESFRKAMNRLVRTFGKEWE